MRNLTNVNKEENKVSESKKNTKNNLRAQQHYYSERIRELGLEPFEEMVLYGAAIE